MFLPGSGQSENVCTILEKPILCQRWGLKECYMKLKLKPRSSLAVVYNLTGR